MGLQFAFCVVEWQTHEHWKGTCMLPCGFISFSAWPDQKMIDSAGLQFEVECHYICAFALETKPTMTAIVVGELWKREWTNSSECFLPAFIDKITCNNHVKSFCKRFFSVWFLKICFYTKWQIVSTVFTWKKLSILHVSEISNITLNILHYK